MESVNNQLRTRAVINAILPFIGEDSAKLIDIGAGSCHISKTLSSKYGFDVTAIDVVDHNITDLPLKLYDGSKLPYDDNSFDAGLLVFVLHHAMDTSNLIKEAGRVCKKLIVVEDIPGNSLERQAWKRLDYLFNHARHSDIEVAHEAKSAGEWKALFKQLGYKPVKESRFRSFFTTGLSYPHAVFVFEAK